jgi:hypothetical protein
MGDLAMNKTLAARIRALLDRSEHEEYIDTGDALELLHAACAALEDDRTPLDKLTELLGPEDAPKRVLFETEPVENDDEACWVRIDVLDKNSVGSYYRGLTVDEAIDAAWEGEQ